MRYEVGRPDGSYEGVLAEDVDIHESGALVFYNVDGVFREFNIAYAAGQWTTFFPTPE